MIQADWGNVSAERIAEVELALAVRLPEGYRRFLLEQNGGNPDPCGIEIPGWPYRITSVQALFGIDTNRGYDLVAWAKQLGDRFFKDLLAIGTDAGGSFFCVRLEPPNVGAVVYWDHEEELDDEGDIRRDGGNVYLVADSVQTFIAMLHEPTERAPEDVA